MEMLLHENMVFFLFPSKQWFSSLLKRKGQQSKISILVNKTKVMYGQQNKAIKRGRTSLFDCNWLLWLSVSLYFAQIKMNPFMHQKMVKFLLSPLQKWEFVLFFLKAQI